jgi:hypothetical protein
MARDNPGELRENGHIDTEGFEYVARVARLFDSVRPGESLLPPLISAGTCFSHEPEHLQPPLTGFAATHHSLSSAWITKLFQEAGA